ncbi:hypothetical protein [Aminipila terrae]|uniref:Uncharacterized protein n=1 Tax=Aminipila terrae TaxID=2697030 RepID=A0A6P1MHM4_9FIRM|nr:hypothetical protein [Aminipila terrae]QHI72683.1 hypothetical protein Ami3637_09980 [Aminipila terrae]
MFKTFNLKEKQDIYFSFYAEKKEYIKNEYILEIQYSDLYKKYYRQTHNIFYDSETDYFVLDTKNNQELYDLSTDTVPLK